MAVERPDAVVIGAGAVGLWCAVELARAGLRVLVVERDRPGAGASWGNAGWVVPSHSVPLAEPGALRRGLRWALDPASPLYVPPRWDRKLWRWLWQFRRYSTPAHVDRALPVLVRLQQRSVALYEALSAEGPDFGFRQDGSFTVFTGAGEFAAFLHEVDRLRQEGVRAEVLDASAACGREPLLRPEVTGGVYFPDDAHLDPARMVGALVEHAQQLGVHFRTSRAVLRRRGRGVTVQAGGEELAAKTVVVAAGVWSVPLLSAVGVDVPVLPAKGYSVTLRGRPLVRSPVMLSEARVAVTPLSGPDGPRLRVAGTLELGVWDTELNVRRVAAIREAARRYLQVEPEGGEVWAGLRPCTPDGLPVVGKPGGLDDLVVACGHGTLGISLAPATGELVRSLVTGQMREELALLGPDRFR